MLGTILGSPTLVEVLVTKVDNTPVPADPADPILPDGRLADGSPPEDSGAVTPLRLADGSKVVVLRKPEAGAPVRPLAPLERGAVGKMVSLIVNVLSTVVFLPRLVPVPLDFGYPEPATEPERGSPVPDGPAVRTEPEVELAKGGAALAGPVKPPVGTAPLPLNPPVGTDPVVPLLKIGAAVELTGNGGNEKP